MIFGYSIFLLEGGHGWVDHKLQVIQDSFLRLLVVLDCHLLEEVVLPGQQLITSCLYLAEFQVSLCLLV